MYPAPLFVKNTFLDAFPDRTPSLEGFYNERHIKSAPGSKIAVPFEHSVVREASHEDDTELEEVLGDMTSYSVASSSGGAPSTGVPFNAETPGNSYPSNELHVKNTFIDYKLRTPSMDEEARKVRSCPVSSLQDAAQHDALQAEWQPMSTVTADGDDLGMAVADQTAAAHPPVHDLLSVLRAPPPPTSASATPARVGAVQVPRVVEPPARSAAQVLSLSDALPAEEPEEISDDRIAQLQAEYLQGGFPHPVVGSPGCPSIGSIAHGFRLCKPCAFASKGCASGAECNFCHLCEPGEKKKRKKEKQQIRKEMMAWQQGFPQEAASWRYQQPTTVTL